MATKTRTFAEAFRAARLARGWSQRRAEVELGVPLRTIQYWEDGTHTPSIEFVNERLIPFFPEWEVSFLQRPRPHRSAMPRHIREYVTRHLDLLRCRLAPPFGSLGRGMYPGRVIRGRRIISTVLPIPAG